MHMCQELEGQVVGIAEAYTSNAVRSILEPILSFLAQVTAASRTAATSATSSSEGEATPSPPPLSTLAFAQPAKVKALLTAAETNIKEKLPPVANTLRLYLKGISFPSNHHNIMVTLKVPPASVALPLGPSPYLTCNQQENILGYMEQFGSVLRRAGYDEAFAAEVDTALKELDSEVSTPLYQQ